MIIRMQCPNCGAAVDFDDTRELMFCTYCGTKIVNASARSPFHVSPDLNTADIVPYVQPAGIGPNLYIEYTTLRPQYNLLVQHKRDRWFFAPGEQQCFTLEPGKHVLRFRITDHARDKVIVIPQDNTPVRIKVDYARRVSIYIDQPRWK